MLAPSYWTTPRHKVLPHETLEANHDFQLRPEGGLRRHFLDPKAWCLVCASGTPQLAKPKHITSTETYKFLGENGGGEQQWGLVGG